ncbi:MAG: hypothetical protein KAR19_08685 [Bacteroidales bacterium]|nr:hypothetical protein [Bacteroidales bacterium]
MVRRLILSFIIILPIGLFGQGALVVSLSLRNVVDLAISQSSSVKYIQNRDVNFYWRWKNHQTRFRPQLTLSGSLPDFENQTIELIIPLDMFLFKVDPDKALSESLENRKETPQFERRLIIADRDLTQARRNAGVSATLRMSYGISNSADDFGGVYENILHESDAYFGTIKS